MKIGIDGNEVNIENRAGTGQYTERILAEWYKNREHDFHIYLRESPLSHLPQADTHWHYHVLGPRYGWTRFALPFYLTAHKHDVFWNPAHYLPPITSCPSVVTIHDLAYEYFPELFLPQDLYKLKNWTKSSVKNATRVIAVSEATKQDLIRTYNVSKDKVMVISNGYDADLFNTTKAISTNFLTSQNLKPNGYLLYVGTIQPRKNVIKLVQAFRIMKASGYKGKLVIAGKIGWLADETLAAVDSSPDKKEIVVTGYIDDQTRLTLYRHAQVFVLPSLYEGFGVGALEAMAVGTPVAVSDNSSLPEVVGEAGVYFNPTDPEDMANSITKVINNRDKYSQKALFRAKNYSWKKTAKETLKTIINFL